MQKLKLFLFSVLACFPLLTLSAFSHKIPPERTLNPVLIQYLSSTFNQPKWLMQKVVRQAVIEGRTDKFPTPYDILAVASIESELNPYAVSPRGAIGIMQINPVYWNILGARDSAANIKTGAFVLKEYHGQFKTTNGALIAYNAGPGAALKKCIPGKAVKSCASNYSIKFHAAKAEIKSMPLFSKS